MMAMRASVGKKVHFCNLVVCSYYSDSSAADVLTLKQAVLIIVCSEWAEGQFLISYQPPLPTGTKAATFIK